MSHAAPGRHRAAPSPNNGGRAVLIGAIAAVSLAVLVGVGWWLANRPGAGSDPGTDVPGATSPSRSDAGASEGADPISARVDTQKRVSIKGTTVTVEETSTVLAGDAVRVTPTTTVADGLKFVRAEVVTAEGRSTPFTDPVRLAPSGSVTVRGRYQLTDCPDLLPSLWPSPADYPSSTRTYSRLEEPLHTAYAICPGKKSRASSIADLNGSVGEDVTPTVRLSWSGSGQLTVKAVGSASGVAVLVVEPACGGSCAAEIAPGAASTISLQPVDPCPPASSSDRLTFLLDNGKVVAIDVRGLHGVICK